jgi:hypothetical protein
VRILQQRAGLLLKVIPSARTTKTILCALANCRHHLLNARGQRTTTALVRRTSSPISGAGVQSWHGRSRFPQPGFFRRVRLPVGPLTRENVSRILNGWSPASWRANCPAITALRATKHRQQETDLQSAGVAAIAGLFVFLLPVALSASIAICPSATKSTLRGEVRRQARPMVRPGSGAVKRSNFTR